MLKLLVWTFCLYAGLKFGHLVTGAGLGFGRSEATLSSRLRAGEPMLLIGTLGVCALLLLYTAWWSRRFLDGHYAYATDCYSRMAASHLLPGRPGRFSSFDAAERSRWYAASARKHGGELGIRADVIGRKLVDGRAAYAVRYARLANRKQRAEIAASFEGLDRCLTGDGAPKGELLRPA